MAIQARLLYRRTFRALQVEKGWTQSAHSTPIEIEVARQAADVTLAGGTAATEVPAASPASLIVLALALATLRAYRLRPPEGDGLRPLAGDDEHPLALGGERLPVVSPAIESTSRPARSSMSSSSWRKIGRQCSE